MTDTRLWAGPLTATFLRQADLDALEVVLSEGAAKHPDIETGARVDLRHEFAKATWHLLLAVRGNAEDADSGQEHEIHALARVLKVLRTRERW